MPGGLRYNHFDLLEMKCCCSYFRVIIQRPKFSRIHNRKEIFMNKAHCFLRVRWRCARNVRRYGLRAGRTGAVLTEKRAERRPSGGEAIAPARRSTSILKT